MAQRPNSLVPLFTFDDGGETSSSVALAEEVKSEKKIITIIHISSIISKVKVKWTWTELSTF